MNGKIHTLVVMAALAVTSAGMAEEATVATLLLSTDQSRYYVGEPVRLGLIVTNHSDQEISGYFLLVPEHERTSVFVRRHGQPFTKLELTKPSPEAQYIREQVHHAPMAPIRIPSKKDYRSARYVITRPDAQQLVFDEPGQYEMYIESRALIGKTETVLRSDTALIQVDAPPSQHREALADYLSMQLPSLYRGWPFFTTLDKEKIAKATAFLEKHPHGPYAETVRVGLARGLRKRVRGPDATVEEKALYAELKDSLPEDERERDPDGSLQRARDLVEQRRREKAQSPPR